MTIKMKKKIYKIKEQHKSRQVLGEMLKSKRKKRRTERAVRVKINNK
jgi:hypothetical protein